MMAFSCSRTRRRGFLDRSDRTKASIAREAARRRRFGLCATCGRPLSVIAVGSESAALECKRCGTIVSAPKRTRLYRIARDTKAKVFP